MIVETFLGFLSRIFCFTAMVSNESSFPRPLTQEEEREYVLKMQEGDAWAREELIRHNLRLVAHIVKKYSGAGEADDLISVGSIGLIKGVDSFKLGKGSTLATYVARCIDNEILMYIRANKKHRAVTSLSDAVGVDKDGNEITLMEIIPAGNDNMIERVERDVIMKRVAIAIEEKLTDREKRIMYMRYGLNGEAVKTQLEIAKELKISRSYVSRIEKKAIEKLSKEFCE